MSPQRFNRILLSLVAVFILFTAVAYAASAPVAADASAHKGLCPKLEDTELLWEMLVRKAVSATVCR